MRSLRNKKVSLYRRLLGSTVAICLRNFQYFVTWKIPRPDDCQTMVDTETIVDRDTIMSIQSAAAAWAPRPPTPSNINYLSGQFCKYTPEST